MATIRTTSELVWFKNPGGLGANGENWEGWEQNVLVEGPDVFIQIIELESAGTTYEVLVTAELWSERIMIYYVPAGVPGAWADPANIQSNVVDPGSGTPFHAWAYDLNMDGKITKTMFVDFN